MVLLSVAKSSEKRPCAATARESVEAAAAFGCHAFAHARDAALASLS
jgi:hypothetical protein